MLRAKNEMALEVKIIVFGSATAYAYLLSLI
jgi:hypothetical protein